MNKKRWAEVKRREVKLETSARGFDKDLYGLNLQKFGPAGSPLSAKRRHASSSCPRKLLALACGLFLGDCSFPPDLVDNRLRH